MDDKKNSVEKEQNDAFTGQSATKESADPKHTDKRWYEIKETKEGGRKKS
ncbi:hypothetical protein [Costertonia aggregata]|uniref:Uncharacterized protein n=1 Tax=Costertonia aggregata TaxID=343403 RepID=A0A7H9ASW5_9FLAO|nr:hypothetical protein [Costertonia aggregata]QLG46563.1 hypothetical protein HYG79_14805 [Costertonia aggregata]